MGKIQQEIDRVTEICALCYSRKTSTNRYKFAQYSDVLKKVEYLYAQKKHMSNDFRKLFAQLQSFE